MNKRLSVFSVLTLLTLVASCGKTSEPSIKPETSKEPEVTSLNESTGEPSESVSVAKEFGVYFKETLPIVRPYKEFDIMEVIETFEGAEYSFSGIYLDGRMNEKIISFDGSKFIVPQDNTAAEIEVTATLDEKEDTKTVTLSVMGEADVIDFGLYDNWHEDTINKALNFNPEYIKDGDSSVKVTFNGFYVRHGIQFSCISGHLSNNDEIGIYDTPYYSIYQEPNVEEAFKDAVAYFWVYNAMKEQPEGFDDSLYFGCRCKESPNHGNGVNVDWGETPVLEAKRGEWTLIYWYLKDMGKVTEFYKDVETYYAVGIPDEVFRASYDEFNLKVLGKNVEKIDNEFSTETKYSFTFYFDGYNIMTREMFESTFAEYLDLD